MDWVAPYCGATTLAWAPDHTLTTICSNADGIVEWGPFSAWTMLLLAMVTMVMVSKGPAAEAIKSQVAYHVTAKRVLGKKEALIDKQLQESGIDPSTIR